MSMTVLQDVQPSTNESVSRMSIPKTVVSGLFNSVWMKDLSSAAHF